jgi:hypothetical protein
MDTNDQHNSPDPNKQTYELTADRRPRRYFLFVHYGTYLNKHYVVDKRRQEIRILDPMIERLIGDLRYLTELLRPNEDDENEVWVGRAFVFVDPGWAELLKLYQQKTGIESVVKEDEKTGVAFFELGASLQRVHDDLYQRLAIADCPFNQFGKECPERRKVRCANPPVPVQIVTARQLLELLHILERNIDVRARGDCRDFLVGGVEKMRYDAPKVVEAAIRIANIGRQVPIFRFDDDVIFYGQRQYDTDKSDITAEERDKAATQARKGIMKLCERYRKLSRNPKVHYFAFSGGYQPPNEDPTIPDEERYYNENGKPPPIDRNQDMEFKLHIEEPVVENVNSEEKTYHIYIDKINDGKLQFRIFDKEYKKILDVRKPDLHGLDKEFENLSKKLGKIEQKKNLKPEDEQGIVKTIISILDQGHSLDLLNGFATRIMQLADLPKQRQVKDEDIPVTRELPIMKFLRSLHHVGADPFRQVVSGAGLCLSDGAILDLPPFSNMRLNVMWIDDHLKYSLHHELGHFDIHIGEVDHARVEGAIFPQLRKAPNYENVRWHLGTYMLRLILGCVADAWLRKVPQLKKSLTKRFTVDGRIQVQKIKNFLNENVPHLYAKQFLDVLPENREDLKRAQDFKQELWKVALIRVRQLAQDWALEDYQGTFLDLFVSSNARYKEHRDFLPKAFKEGLAKVAHGLPDEYPPLSPGYNKDEENPDLQDALVLLADGFVQYFQWFQFWKYFVYSVRFMLNRDRQVERDSKMGEVEGDSKIGVFERGSKPGEGLTWMFPADETILDYENPIGAIFTLFFKKPNKHGEFTPAEKANCADQGRNALEEVHNNKAQKYKSFALDIAYRGEEGGMFWVEFQVTVTKCAGDINKAGDTLGSEIINPKLEESIRNHIKDKDTKKWFRTIKGRLIVWPSGNNTISKQKPPCLKDRTWFYRRTIRCMLCGYLTECEKASKGNG